MSCYAIVPAAGSGSRFGSEMPKQFLPLRGRPVIAWAVERFLAAPDVARIIIPTQEAYRDTLADLARAHGWSDVEIVIGGATRQESVLAGLRACRNRPSLVAVHDAVRPYFAPDTLRRLLAAAEETGAAVPVAPVNDTIHVVEDGRLVTTLERSHLRAAQTPQCFRFDLLASALEQAVAEGVTGTDEAGIVARTGHPVVALEGDRCNVKITRPEDLRWMESTWEQWSLP